MAHAPVSRTHPLHPGPPRPVSAYIALLRGINVGGRNVKMDRLREIFAGMGFTEVATYIASGNVIFSGEGAEPSELVTAIEAKLREGLGYEVRTMIRTGEEISAVAAYRPFPRAIGETSAAMNVAFMREELPSNLRTSILTLRSADDDFHTHGREIYWLARNGIGKSPAWPAFEKLLAGQGTVRNINTVRTLAERFFSNPRSAR